MEYEIEYCNGEVEPLGGTAVLQVVPQGEGEGCSQYDGGFCV